MSSWDKRLGQWFGAGRAWRVMTERDGEVTTSGVRIAYHAGAFEIDPPGAYATPFGSRGRRGILIERTDGQESDLPVAAAFGESVLRQASEKFGTITGLPEEDG